MRIPRTIPGKPAPDPRSVHTFISFLLIKSIVCAVSFICLKFIAFSVLLLIRFITLFFEIISSEKSSSSFNVSRETLNFEFLVIFKICESIKLCS